MARRFARQGRVYLTLDDRATLAAARSDPVAFIRGLDRTVIDEVQRAPEILLAIKRSVDEDRRPGRFLLTGSANLSTIATVRESLAGRIETIPLYPLSRSELIRRKRTQFPAKIFRGEVPSPAESLSPEAVIQLVSQGDTPKRLRGARSGGGRTGTAPISNPSSSWMCRRLPRSASPGRFPSSCNLQLNSQVAS